MSALGETRALCEAYIARAEQLERDRKPGEGIFGMRGGPRDNPCHQQFADDFERLMQALAGQRPSSGEAREALAYAYGLALAHTEPLTAYWMLQAIHGLTLPLIALLSPQDARALRDDYARDYPRSKRLPAQEQVCKALEKAAKGA